MTEWRIAINVSKSNTMLFAKAGWRISKPRPVQFLGEPIQWVDTARYFGVILDSRMTWSPHIVQVRKKAAQRLGLFGSLLHSNGQIHENLGVPFFAEHIRALTESYDSKVSWCGEPLSSATLQIFTLTEG